MKPVLLSLILFLELLSEKEIKKIAGEAKISQQNEKNSKLAIGNEEFGTFIAAEGAQQDKRKLSADDLSAELQDIKVISEKHEEKKIIKEEVSKSSQPEENPIQPEVKVNELPK